MTHLHVDTDTAARKREEIGLSPRRETARKMVMRPPESTGLLPAHYWLAGGLVALVALLTLGVVVTRAMGRAESAESAAPVRVEVEGTTGAARLVWAGDATIKEEFLDTNGPLVRDLQPDRWSMGVIESEGVYRIRVLPGVVAWSTLGTGATPAYRFSTSLLIPTETPRAAGGIVARYSDDGSLCLVQVDGLGRLRVQVVEKGKLRTLQEWQPIPELEPAGAYNHLLVEDTGQVFTIFANGVAVWATEELDLPAGDLGVLGASESDEVAEANFDWVQLEPLDPPEE